MWSLFAAPLFWQQASLEQLASSVIAGESFNPEGLAAVADRVDLTSLALRPSLAGKLAAIRLRLLEKSLATGELKDIDSQYAAFDDIIMQSLKNSPADPLLWAVSFWLRNTTHGFTRDHLGFLAMSYKTGPNEGWLAARRNALALAIYSELPDSMADMVADEFAGLVQSRFTSEAVDILLGPGWPLREKLISKLKDVDIVARQRFALAVYKEGYNIVVPGIDQREFRPWH